MWFMITNGTRWVARHATSVAGAFSAASKVRRYSIVTVQCWPHTGRQSGMITHHNLATNADRSRPEIGAITVRPRLVTGSGPRCGW